VEKYSVESEVIFLLLKKNIIAVLQGLRDVLVEKSYVPVRVEC